MLLAYGVESYDVLYAVRNNQCRFLLFLTILHNLRSSFMNVSAPLVVVFTTVVDVL